MSLINEALKRAEQDKLRHLNGDESAAEPAGGGDASPAPEPTDDLGGVWYVDDDPTEPRWKLPGWMQPAWLTARMGRVPAAVFAGVAIALGVTLALVWAWSSDPAPTSADAVAPAVGDVEPFALPHAILAGQSAEVHRPNPVDVPPAPRPVSEPAAAPAPVAAPPQPSAPSPEPTPTEIAMAALRPSAVRPTVDEAPSADPLSEPAPPAAPASADPDPAADVPATQPEAAPEPVDPLARFHLGGIMRFGSSATATINGQLLREGDTILGATILEISNQAVMLEIDGQRHMLGL